MSYEIAKIEKGEISAFEEGETRARIKCAHRDDYVTDPLIIPWWLLWELGELEVGTEVAFVEFYDYTGVILHRMDNEGGKVFRWKVRSLVDFISEDVSGKHHVHPGVEAGPDKTDEPEGGAV